MQLLLELVHQGPPLLLLLLSLLLRLLARVWQHAQWRWGATSGLAAGLRTWRKGGAQGPQGIRFRQQLATRAAVAVPPCPAEQDAPVGRGVLPAETCRPQFQPLMANEDSRLAAQGSSTRPLHFMEARSGAVAAKPRQQRERTPGGGPACGAAAWG